MNSEEKKSLSDKEQWETPVLLPLDLGAAEGGDFDGNEGLNADSTPSS